MEATIYPSARATALIFDRQRHGSRKRLFEFLATIAKEDFVRPIPEAGGKSLRDHLLHVVGADEFWVSLIQNRDHRRFEASEYTAVELIQTIFEEVSDRIDHLLSDCDEDWFTREMTVSHHGKTEMIIPAMVAFHMLTHEYHHKGQIMLIARILRYEPPDSDLI